MTLTRAQQAAAIVLAIGKDRAGRLIGQFRREELKLLVDAARSLRNIAQPDLQALSSQFEKEFRAGAGLVDSAAMMDVILGQSFSAEEVEKLGEDPAALQAEMAPAVDVWKALESVEPERLAAFLGEQPPHAVAFIVGRLPPEQTTAVLRGLDDRIRRPLFAHMLAVTDVPAVTQKIISTYLADALDLGGSGPRGSEENVSKIAEILNAVSREDADRYLAEIEEATSEANAAAVRARLFRFDDVVRLDQSARTAIFDGMGSDTIIAALADTDDALREAVLGAISQRMRRMAEAELESARTPAEQVRLARRAIVATVMKLAADGRLVLPSARSE